MEPPEINLSMSRDGDGWTVDISVAGVPSERIDVTYRKYGASIRVADPVDGQ